MKGGHPLYPRDHLAAFALPPVRAGASERGFPLTYPHRSLCDFRGMKGKPTACRRHRFASLRCACPRSATSLPVAELCALPISENRQTALDMPPVLGGLALFFTIRNSASNHALKTFYSGSLPCHVPTLNMFEYQPISHGNVGFLDC